ncbi:hypothetical protein MJO29_016656 [Puccinia striiformis f. sp. tritici]|nr:hypothetical protein MJO29_016656 [Puccinia striiformis f. sp. tritici]
MREHLLARDGHREHYQGGLLSNVTYRYFENGYLLLTSMFCEQLQQWIPVQLTWIQGLSKEYYQVHFTVPLKQFFAPGITVAEREGLCRQVVDFCKAQANGFKAAYKDVFRDPSDVNASAMLKGCHQHYTTQVA